MYTKEQLIELSKPYFKNNEIDSILAVSDGNFFYKENLTDARNHERSANALTLVEITREEAKVSKAKTAEEPVEEVVDEIVEETTVEEDFDDLDDLDDITVDEIKAFLKDKGVKFHKSLGEKKLRALYEQNKN